MITQGQDKLVTCKCCGSNACYESEFTTKEGKVETWLCMTCGFTSNTTMTDDSDTLKETLEFTADLIKDLRQDHDGLVYFPTVIQMPEKGMIFPDIIKGSSTLDRKLDWGWTVVKNINIPEEEKEKYPDPTNPGTFYEKRMDMKNLKRFGKLEFMDAAEELGMFDKDLVNGMEINTTSKNAD
tara:strand:- start:230 stop:775 length:546 start_codon:yes stop_codon:yes gene_type:complete